MRTSTFNAVVIAVVIKCVALAVRLSSPITPTVSPSTGLSASSSCEGVPTDEDLADSQVTFVHSGGKNEPFYGAPLKEYRLEIRSDGRRVTAEVIVEWAPGTRSIFARRHVERRVLAQLAIVKPCSR